MTHAIRFHAPGGPDVLRWEEVGVGDTAAPWRGTDDKRPAGAWMDVNHQS